MAVPAFMQKYMKENKATLAAEEKNSGVIRKYYDTGSYVLNALVSADMFKGIAGNKIIGLGGPSGCGKTYFALSIIKSFLNDNPTGYCVWYDTESTISKELLDSRNIDSNRVLIVEPAHVNDFKVKIMQFMNEYQEIPMNERIPIIMVLDSIGMLPDNKEIEDASNGDPKADQGGRAKKIKSLFRTITSQLGVLDIPLIVTSHTYSTMDMFPQEVLSSGVGLVYSASTIICLGKALEKDGKDVVGVILRCKAMKSRLSKENNVVRVLLNYKNGINRYYGLLDLAEASGIWKKVGTRYDVGGKLVFGKNINENPEQYFTQDVLNQINEYVKKVFSYGSNVIIDVNKIEQVDNEENKNENENENFEQ